MKTLIEMARLAGAELCELPRTDAVVFGVDDLEWNSAALQRFAELVRADERNRTWTQEHWTEYERSIVEAEREACARVCDEQAERSKLVMEKSKRTTDYAVYRAGAQTAAWNAAEIRARSNT